MIFQNVTVGIALKEILALDIWQNVHHGSLGECSTIFCSEENKYAFYENIQND